MVAVETECDPKVLGVSKGFGFVMRSGINPAIAQQIVHKIWLNLPHLLRITFGIVPQTAKNCVEGGPHGFSCSWEAGHTHRAGLGILS
jgi:hypothetical protein